MLYLLFYLYSEATKDINQLNTLYSQANLSTIDAKIRLQQKTLDTSNEFYVLPNQIDTEIKE